MPLVPDPQHPGAFRVVFGETSQSWVDPARPALAGRGVGDPEDFMRHTSEFVNRSIVLHSQVEASNGTTVTAWVRRGEDGLFSVLTADGPLDADGQREADALEARVRDAVGLD